MLPRALRALLEGAQPPPGPEPGVVLSSYRPCPPDAAPPAAEEREEGPGGALFAPPPPGGAPPGLLRAAPLPRLVRHLLEAPARGDVTFGPAFLATLRAIAPPRPVLRLLLRRMEELGALAGTPSTPELLEAKAALAPLLASWLDQYPEDFGDPQAPPLLEPLLQVLGPGSELARRLEALGGAPPPSPAGAPPPEEEEGEGEGEGQGGEGQDADPLEILSFQAREVAEELTRMDAELFLRLVPHECLGAFWSRRGQRGHEAACASVRATVGHFNRLAGAVVRSCLGGAGLRPPQRARLLEKWIRVAEECRALRNFSSLCAIVSALRSSPIHRLRQSWEETSREAQRSYEELSALCSEQDNYSASRRLLRQDPSPEPPPRRQPRHPPQQRPLGVVPYLGTFLRDLAMLDAAMEDELENGYINFEKRRKEFAVLARVRELQGLCRGYRGGLHPQPRFRRWLRTLRGLPEAHSHSLSCQIEPPGAPPPRSPRSALVITHCTELLSSVGAPAVAWDQPSPPEVIVTPPPGPPPPPSPREQVKWPSVSALEGGSPSPPDSPPGPLPPPAPPRAHRRSASCGSAFPPKPGGGAGGAGGGLPPPDCCIIRARLAPHTGSLYKSILISSQDKAPAVVAKVLEKHGEDPGAAPRFQLLQLLPENRELLFPPSANVFYAMSGASRDFTLRPREAGGVGGPDAAPPAKSQPRGGEFHPTFPKIKATGRKITRALFWGGGGGGDPREINE